MPDHRRFANSSVWYTSCVESRLKSIIISLADAKVRFIVAGGVAAVMHGVERVTMDIDLAVDMRRNNIETFIRVMKELGLKPRVPVPPESLLDGKQVKMFVEEKNAIVFTFVHPVNPLWHVDLFLKEELSFKNLKDDVVIVEIEGRSVRVLSPQKLIELKERVLPARDKDLWDIAALKEIIEGKP